MDVFNDRVRYLIETGVLKKDSLVCQQNGTLKSLGPFSKKLLSRLSPQMREKMFGVNNDKLTKFVAEYLATAPKDTKYSIIEDNVNFLKEEGTVSNVPSKEKERANVKKAWESIQ